MQYPNAIKLGGIQLKVLVSEDKLEHPFKPGNYIHGAYLTDQQAIVLWDNPTCPSSTAETFWHEILEAIAATYDLALSHQDIKTMSTALHQVMDDNFVVTSKDTASEHPIQ